MAEKECRVFAENPKLLALDVKLFTAIADILERRKWDLRLQHSADQLFAAIRRQVSTNVRSSPVNAIRSRLITVHWMDFWSRLQVEILAVFTNIPCNFSQNWSNYLLSRIVFAESRQFMSTVTTSTTTVKTSVASPNTASIKSNLPPAIGSRYDRTCGSYIRNAKILLRGDKWTTDRELKERMRRLLTEVCVQEEVLGCGGRKLKIRPQFLEIAQLIDVHALKHFQIVSGASALKKLLEQLCSDQLLTKRIFDVVCDGTTTYSLKEINAFVHLLVKAGAGSLWKYVTEKAQLNEKAKGELSFRMGLKYRALILRKKSDGCNIR